MPTIKDKDAAKLATIIYIPELTTVIDNKKAGEDKKIYLDEVVDALEAKIKNKKDNKIIGAEMTKEEFLDVLDQVKASDELMRLEVVNYANTTPIKADESIDFTVNTDFRAITLKDPKKELDPVIVFRGSNGNGQWDDNFAAIYSSRTPSQKEAIKYVVDSGLEQVTLAGHSKGGNLAAACAYVLPKGMVNKVYSLDGQGLSKKFLSEIPALKQKESKEIIYNINEYRDIASQLLNKTGADKNTTYFNSGIDYKDTRNKGDALNIKMLIGHPHKPNYYLLDTTENIDHSFVPARGVNFISNLSLVDHMSGENKIMIAKKISHGFYSDGSKSEWSSYYWDCVLEAEEVYSYVNKSREEAISRKLTELYGIDFSKYELDQKDTSNVVDGAIIACSYSNNIGTLKVLEPHGTYIADKLAASKKDTIVGVNIIMEEAICTANTPINLFNSIAGRNKDLIIDGTQKCIPEIFCDWLLTDEDKKIKVNGQDIEAVLKKSVLGCCKGGIIIVVENGQFLPKDKSWKDETKDIFDGMKNSIIDAYDEGKDALVDAYDKTKDVVVDVYNETKDDVVDTYHDIKDAVVDAYHDAKDAVVDAYGETKDAIEEFFE